jgi:hypothetical protein
MRLDSEITLGCLRDCERAGIAALPVHDELFVSGPLRQPRGRNYGAKYGVANSACNPLRGKDKLVAGTTYGREAALPPLVPPAFLVARSLSQRGDFFRRRAHSRWKCHARARAREDITNSHAAPAGFPLLERRGRYRSPRPEIT